MLGRLGHPNLIDTYANLGSLLIKTGNFATAKGILCKALGLERAAARPGSYLVGNDHSNLGHLYYAMGDKIAARARSSEGAGHLPGNVKCKRLPKKHPYIAEAQDWLKQARC